MKTSVFEGSAEFAGNNDNRPMQRNSRKLIYVNVKILTYAFPPGGKCTLKTRCEVPLT